jgi:hypothetical protein
MRRAEERLPEGFYIARWYWDVESGGTDLDERSRTDVWEKFAYGGTQLPCSHAHPTDGLLGPELCSGPRM